MPTWFIFAGPVTYDWLNNSIMFTCIWQLLSVMLVDVALQLKYVVKANLTLT